MRQTGELAVRVEMRRFWTLFGRHNAGSPLDNQTSQKSKPTMPDFSTDKTQESFSTSLSTHRSAQDIQDEQLLGRLNSLIDFDVARRWRFVPEYESFYAISNDGHIVSLPRPKKNRMRLMVRRMETKSGGVVRGPFASLSRSESKADSTRKELHYDELILRAFVGPKPWPRSIAIYIDSTGNTPKLHLSNLQWSTLPSSTDEESLGDIHDSKLLSQFDLAVAPNIDRRWRYVKGMSKCYAVSSDGHIVRLPRTGSRDSILLLKPSITIRDGKMQGSPKATLVEPATLKSFQRSYSTVMLEAFHGPKPSEKHYARILHEDKTNLHVDHIVWQLTRPNPVTPLETHTLDFDAQPSSCDVGPLEDIDDIQILAVVESSVATVTGRRWRFVRGLAKAYVVSNDGHILRLPRPNSREQAYLLKPSLIRRKGKIEGSPRAKLIHPVTSEIITRSYSGVMLEAFHGPKPSEEHRARILHEDKTNLHIDHLEWYLTRSKPVTTLDTQSPNFHCQALSCDEGPLEDIDDLQLLTLVESSTPTRDGRRWRFVRGLAKAYVVSNDGHILKMPRPGSCEKPYLLKPSLARSNGKIKGSPRANLTHPVTFESIARSYSAVMLEAFHGPKPSNEHHARILHEDKTNLHIDHMEWYVAPSKPPKTPRPPAKEKTISDVRNKEMLHDLNNLCPKNESRRWRPIKNYERIYFISDDGHIVRIANREKDATHPNVGKGLRLCARLKITTDGVFYGYSAKLTKDGVSRYATYAALMLETFVGAKPSEDSVAHNMNGNAEEILLSNLEWSTRKKIRMQFIHGDANAISLKSESWSEWNLYIRLLYCALNSQMLQLTANEAKEFVERSPDACKIEVYRRIAKAAEDSKKVRIESLECSSLWGIEGVRKCFNIEARHIGLEVTEKGAFRISRQKTTQP